MKKFFLCFMIVLFAGSFRVVATARAQGGPDWCWCLAQDGTCQKFEDNDGSQFPTQSDCDNFCPTQNGAKSIHYDQGKYIDESQDPQCKNGGNPGNPSWCWCLTPDGTCQKNEADANGDPFPDQPSCNQFCSTQNGAKAIHFDQGKYIDESKDPQCKTPPPAGGGGLQAPPTQSGAQGGGKGGSTTHLYNPLGEGTDVFSFIGRIITAVIGIIGSLALLAFVYGGVLWLTAGEGSDRVKRAKQVMVNATIGLLIIIFSYAAVNLFLKAFSASYETTQPAAQQPGT